MKRTKALRLIKQAGFHGELAKAEALRAEHGIGSAACRKAYFDGRKLARWGEPCDCLDCQKAREAAK